MYCALKLAPNSNTSLLSTTSTIIPPSSFACSCQFHSYFDLVLKNELLLFNFTNHIALTPICDWSFFLIYPVSNFPNELLNYLLNEYSYNLYSLFIV